MHYRRSDIAGGTYFFTVNLAERERTLLTGYANILREVIRTVKERRPFDIDAMVVLPDHLHMLWTLPDGDHDFATRLMLIKAGFSRSMDKGEPQGASRLSKGERGIWQRRYWEHLIRDERDFENHVNYIHYNPVKHGHVERAVDWKFSSIHCYIKTGILSEDWGCGEAVSESGEFGER
ncbi:MAG: transposase [Gammaproteobacteria bacterium]|nr:transposase [Gammaproteobacteria bacterium]MCF6362887.1 transposase [Gammaproteobacteria bacterium]